MARSFIHRTSQPLLTSRLQVVETMYWHEIPDEGYRLTLELWRFAPPPTWREFFVSEGSPHRTDKDVEKICPSRSIHSRHQISFTAAGFLELYASRWAAFSQPDATRSA
jgi:hypothetical protein